MTQGTVLVGFAEALSAPEVVWSLVDNGFKVTAFARKGRRSALHHSRHVVCHEITPPELDLQTAISDLRELLASLNLNNGGRRVLFPLDDTAVWVSSKILLYPGWVLAGPRQDHADLALDKFLQVNAAIDAGFSVPETVLAKTASDVLSTSQSFPLVLKPAFSVSLLQNRLYKGSSWICGNRNELESAVTEWAERVPLLVQPYIRGTGEGVFGIATSEGIRAWSAHKRLRMMNPHGSGSSACASQVVAEELKVLADRLITKAGWRGLFMIELLRCHEGTAWFMELNGRPWGSMALARRQGLEYPAWNVGLAIDPELRIDIEQSDSAGLVCRHLGRELMYPLFVLRGPKSKAINHWPSFWKAIRDIARIRQGDCLYNWQKDDPNVLLSDCYYTMCDQVFKHRQ